MSAILSFVRKDLRLLRWPWLGWMGLFAAKLGLAAWVLTAPEFTSDDNTLALRLNIALTGLTMLAGAVLVAWLVQADAPQRAQVFWRTRPISGGQLLVAKALTAAMLFFVGPVLLALPWWLFNGMPAADIVLSTLVMLLVHAAAFAPVFLIAALVDTMGRAVLWSFVQYGVVICLPLMGRIFSDTGSLIDLERGLAESRILAAAAFVMVGLPWLIVWQYVQRVTVVAVAGLVLIQAVAAMLWLFSPYNLLPGPGAWTELKPELARGIELQPATAAKIVEAKRQGPGLELVYVHTYWPITGIPKGFVIYPDLVTASVTSASGGANLVENAYSSSIGFWQFISMLGVKELEKDASPASPQLSIPAYIGFGVAPKEVDKLIAYPPAMDVSLGGTLRRVEIVFNQPLREGDWHVDTNRGLRLVRVESESSSVRVDFVKTRAVNLFSLIRGFCEKVQGRSGGFSDFDRSGYFLVQPENGIMSSLTMGKGELRILGILLDRNTIWESPRTSWRDGKREPFSGDLAAWRAGLRIARVAQHEEARFSLKGRTEALVIEDSRTKKNGVAGQAGTETSTSAP